MCLTTFLQLLDIKCLKILIVNFSVFENFTFFRLSYPLRATQLSNFSALLCIFKQKFTFSDLSQQQNEPQMINLLKITFKINSDRLIWLVTPLPPPKKIHHSHPESSIQILNKDPFLLKMARVLNSMEILAQEIKFQFLIQILK